MTEISIISWNINSIKMRIALMTDLIKQYQPDVILLQEIKCQTDKFPYLEFEELGYNIAVHGQKTFNGVAILSKYPISDVINILPGNEADEQARYIEAVVNIDNNIVRVANVYVPNGSKPYSEKFAYKLDFMEKLKNHINNLLEYEESFVIGGDFNVAIDDIDVYDPVNLHDTLCFHYQEKEQFNSIINLGMTDAFRALNPQLQKFSWWDYRASSYVYNKGMRIDYLLLSPQAADRLGSCDILADYRAAEKPSDHAPVIVNLV
ncbi:MAG: exodeoxyribonuclease III [Pseudomonadota bacterium]